MKFTIKPEHLKLLQRAYVGLANWLKAIVLMSIATWILAIGFCLLPMVMDKTAAMTEFRDQGWNLVPAWFLCNTLASSVWIFVKGMRSLTGL